MSPCFIVTNELIERECSIKCNRCDTSKNCITDCNSKNAIIIAFLKQIVIRLSVTTFVITMAYERCISLFQREQIDNFKFIYFSDDISVKKRDVLKSNHRMKAYRETKKFTDLAVKHLWHSIRGEMRS